MENPFKELLDAIEAGGPLPEVSVSDFKWLWEYSQTLPPNTLIGRRILERNLSSGVNLGALYVRSLMLKVLHKQGALADWQHGDQLDEAVFQVAATFALTPGMDRLPGYAIIDELRLKTRSKPKQS